MEIQQLINMGDKAEYKPGFVPVTAHVLGGTYVFQCPDIVHDEGKQSQAYKAWYMKEYKRHAHVLGSRGNLRAMRSIQKEKKAKINWQKKDRRTKGMAARLKSLVASMGLQDIREFFERPNEAAVSEENLD